MTQLPNIELSDEELLYYKNNYCDFGSESIISKGENNQIYKIWKTAEIESTDKRLALLDRKLRKVISYYKLKPKYCTLPTTTLTNRGICIGYGMENLADADILLISPLDRDERIEVLKKMPAILNCFSDQGIIYGDIKNDNILINRKTGSITFCDIDNSKIEEFSMEVYPQELENFITQYGQEDEKIHAYMHNLLTLEQLDNEVCSHHEVIEKMKRNQYDDFVVESGKTLLKQMKRITPQYQKEYIINHVKK